MSPEMKAAFEKAWAAYHQCKSNLGPVEAMFLAGYEFAIRVQAVKPKQPRRAHAH